VRVGPWPQGEKCLSFRVYWRSWSDHEKKRLNKVHVRSRGSWGTSRSSGRGKVKTKEKNEGDEEINNDQAAGTRRKNFSDTMIEPLVRKQAVEMKGNKAF